MKTEAAEVLNLEVPVPAWAEEEGIAEDDIRERLRDAADQIAKDKAERFGPEVMTYIQRNVVLQTLDALWREHLVNLDHLRSVIGFRGYAQRDPLIEYKSEAFELFTAMLGNLRERATSQLMRVEIMRPEEQQAPQVPQMVAHHFDATTGADEIGDGAARLTANFTPVAADGLRRDPDSPDSWGQVGRNEACPCGSGKKFKHCHGAFV